MRTPLYRRTRLVALPVAAALLLGACGSDGEDGASTDGGGSDAGTVNISGSSTVAPISTRVAELLEETGNASTVNVDGPGTGDGFVLFCDGETDISNASRPIKAEEDDVCKENGVDYIELKIAFDGLSVITNPDNDAVACLNFPDLYALAGPESQGFESWADAQALAAELGSETSFPDAPLDITAPGEESGTYDSFIELALSDIAEARAEEGKITEDQIETTRPDYQSSGDDNIILQGIEGSKTSFGWVGLSYVTESGGKVKSIPIASEPGGDCVEPTPETVADGTYPIARALYIYVNKAKAESNQALADYVDFYLSDEGIAAVTEVDYVAVPDDQLEATRKVWTDRTTGTVDGGK